MPTALEEVLRLRSVLHWLPRVVKRDTQFLGHALEEGELVLPVFAAANRDGDQFPDPDRFDVRRSPNWHLGFGQLSVNVRDVAVHRGVVASRVGRWPPIFRLELLRLPVSDHRPFLEHANPGVFEVSIIGFQKPLASGANETLRACPLGVKMDADRNAVKVTAFPVVQAGKKGVLIAEWNEYTPSSGTDIAVTSNLATIA